MFVTGMKDDQKIAAPSLAPSPPAQCWPTLRAARCRVTSSQSPPPALPNSFSLTVFFGGGRDVLRRSNVTGFVSERSRGGETDEEGQVAVVVWVTCFAAAAAPLQERFSPHSGHCYGPLINVAQVTPSWAWPWWVSSEGGKVWAEKMWEWVGEGEQGSLLQKKGKIRMSFLSSIKKVLNIGQTEKKRKLVLQNIKVCTLYEFISIFKSKCCHWPWLLLHNLSTFWITRKKKILIMKGKSMKTNIFKCHYSVKFWKLHNKLTFNTFFYQIFNCPLNRMM